MYIYRCISICTYIHEYINSYKYILMHGHTNTHTHIYIYMYIYTQTHTHTHIYMNLHTSNPRCDLSTGGPSPSEEEPPPASPPLTKIPEGSRRTRRRFGWSPPAVLFWPARSRLPFASPKLSPPSLSSSPSSPEDPSSPSPE